MNSFFDEKPVRTCLLLFALSFLFYLKSVGFEFLPSWDDGEYVLGNTRVHGLTLENLRLIFTTAYFSNYAPLHLLSYAIDFSIWGLSPAGFHLTNIILHGANSFMVYLLARGLTGRRLCLGPCGLPLRLSPAERRERGLGLGKKDPSGGFFLIRVHPPLCILQGKRCKVPVFPERFCLPSQRRRPGAWG